MNRQDLIEAISSDTETSKAAAGRMVDSFLEQIQKAVAAGEVVKLTGFGTFARSNVAARTGRNPKTLQPIAIPATMRPRFVPGAVFKARVKG